MPAFRTFSAPIILAASLAFVSANARTSDDGCLPSDEYQYLCGLDNAEDLVLVPETEYIIASSYGTDAALYSINSITKAWTVLYPSDAVQIKQDSDTYGACPGAPDPAQLVAHGLNIRSGTIEPDRKGHSTLYVVGHGGREAIEVFDVDATGAAPTLTWTGCVLMPEGMLANSVASFADGSLVVTVPLFPGKTITQAMTGEITGAVYEWSPGDSDFRMVKGTDLPYANGIEVSADGHEFYVASSGNFTITAYSHSNPARHLRTSEPMAIVPDNVHMGSDGRLITAGLIAADDTCGNVSGPEVFSLEEFAACPRPFIVEAVDPVSLEIEDIASGRADPDFSNITMGLEVGGELWIGTFSGDRIAYRSIR